MVTSSCWEWVDIERCRPFLFFINQFLCQIVIGMTGHPTTEELNQIDESIKEIISFVKDHQGKEITQLSRVEYKLLFDAYSDKFNVLCKKYGKTVAYDYAASSPVDKVDMEKEEEFAETFFNFAKDYILQILKAKDKNSYMAN